MKEPFVRLHCGKTLIVAITLVVLFLLLPSRAFAQPTPNYVVGTGTAPNLDGKWHQGDWDDAVELRIGYSTISSIPPAYMRLMHDAAWLYFIYDVTFDTTPASNSTPQTPFIVLVFDGNADGFSRYDLNDIELVGQVTPRGLTTLDYEGSNDTNYHPYLAQAISEIYLTQSMGPSPHSSTPHRIWEGKVPLQPLTLNSPKTLGDLSPIIGFNTEVQDALGNWVQLQPLTQTYSVVFLKIAPYPVPENLNLITPFLLAIAILGLYTTKRKRISRALPTRGSR